MRLDKYISLALSVSRKDAKSLIISKKIEVVKDGIPLQRVNVDYDITDEVVYYLDEVINYQENIYIMMNKPSGVLSANSDKYHTCALDLINEYKNRKLGLIGRLDIDTEGLLIITDDGELIHKLTSPKGMHPKKYYLETDNPFDNEDIESFKNGVEINVDDKPYKTKSAMLELISDNKAYLTITEGKFHQVKLMAGSVGKNVTYLKRVAINGLAIDDALKPGEYRLLKESEVEVLKK